MWRYEYKNGSGWKKKHFRTLTDSLDEVIYQRGYFNKTSTDATFHLGIQFDILNSSTILIRGIDINYVKIPTANEGEWNNHFFESWFDMKTTINAKGWHFPSPSIKELPTSKWNQLKKEYDFTAKVVDEDGYTNIRSGPSTQNKIVGKVYVFERFPSKIC